MLGSSHPVFQTCSLPSPGHPPVCRSSESASPGHFMKMEPAPRPSVPGCSRSACGLHVHRVTARGRRTSLPPTLSGAAPQPVPHPLRGPLGSCERSCRERLRRISVWTWFWSLGCGPGSGLRGRTITDVRNRRAPLKRSCLPHSYRTARTSSPLSPFSGSRPSWQG